MIVTRKMAEDAADILQLPLSAAHEYTKEDVECAFRIAAKTAHPDAGGSAESFAAVDRAKHVLLEWLRRQSGTPPPVPDDAAPRRKCHICDGKSYVMQQRGFRAMRVSCGACRGTGDLDTEHDLGDGR